MNEHLYKYLAQWGKDNRISFEVKHYPDCHMLNVTEWVTDDTVRFVMVEYPHRGVRHIYQTWCVSDKIADFIALFDMFSRAIPMQPCSELGYNC